jgi:hypothetical protein
MSTPYGGNDSDNILDRMSPRKKPFILSNDQLLSTTAEHIHNDKYVDRIHDDTLSQTTNESSHDKELDHSRTNQSAHPTSQTILLRLEKILNLCSELRTLAKDVEHHVSTTSKNIVSNVNEIDQTESKQTIIDIDKELNMQVTSIEANENDTRTMNTYVNDAVSDHSLMVSRSIVIRSLMSLMYFCICLSFYQPTESFKTELITSKNSQMTLRKSEDLCMCFLKSYFGNDRIDVDNQHCQLNSNEEEYLSELTRAYLLGREQRLHEPQVRCIR